MTRKEIYDGVQQTDWTIVVDFVEVYLFVEQRGSVMSH